MNEQEFMALKQETVESLEHRVGNVVRAHFGAEAMETVRKAILALDESRYNSWKAADTELVANLVDAKWKGHDPVTQEGQRIAYLHRRWITIAGTLPYVPESHRKLVELCTEESRFNARYENEVPGCGMFLRDAVRAYVKTQWGAWETGRL